MDAAKELESLRKADEDLSGQITAISLVRLGLLVVVTFLFVRALVNTNSGEIAKSLRTVDKNRIAANAATQPLDPLSLLLGSPSWNDPQGHPVHDEPLHSSVHQLRQQYDQAFSFSVSALGASLTMDLRVLILSLPFWLPLLHIYLVALRAKRLAVYATAHTALSAAPKDSQLLDRLVFSAAPARASPYRDFPQNLLTFVSRLGLMVLAVLTVILSWPYLSSGGNNYTLYFLLCSIAIAIYGLAVAISIRSRILAGVRASSPDDYLRNRVERCWCWIVKRAGRLLMRLRPRRWVTAGGALLLLTLVLATGESGCADTTAGYRVLIGKATLAGTNSNFEEMVGRIVYSTAILVALGSLFTGWRVAAPRIRGLLTLASVSLSYFTWAYLVDNVAPYVWVVPWLLATFLWCWYTLAGEKYRRNWPSVRTGIVVAYIPFALVSLLYYVIAVLFRFYGVPVFFFATNILACGYLGWAAQDRERKQQTARPDAPSG